MPIKFSLLSVIWLHGKQCGCMYISNLSVSGWNGRGEIHFSPFTEQLLILIHAVGPKSHDDPLILLNRNLTCCVLSSFSITNSILQNVVESKLEKYFNDDFFYMLLNLM